MKKKYNPFPRVPLSDRLWPSREITQAPLWCSVDLRDGNQALPVPMNVSQKLELWNTLLACGFKEIEVGFPSASNTEFRFNRCLIEEKRIPSDVSIQVLVQCREDLVDRTFASLVGVQNAIIHLYNSTSPAQREIVFGKSKREIVEIAVRGATWIKERLSVLKGSNIRLQYSPESFSATEVEFAKDIAEAVMSVWQPTPERKMILNLPCTVEVAMPNIYADQVEWIGRNIRNRDSLVLSVHTHNDRGTGVASTELALLAGAERVEGTLFGNGERTGNLDIITLALNLYTQGIDPQLNIFDLNKIKDVYERTTGMSVPARHPYSGELVFTAFSGSHQDAIRKGLADWQEVKRSEWIVPYLPIDPSDIGREYREVIRVNSQSGKGGVAYLLESEFGLDIPKDMQREFGPIVNDWVDGLGREVHAVELRQKFWREYIERDTPLSLIEFHSNGNREKSKNFTCKGKVRRDRTEVLFEGKGNGPIAAFVDALIKVGIPTFSVIDYREHALGEGAEASAIAYIKIRSDDGTMRWGAGVDANIEIASIRAALSALNRL